MWFIKITKVVPFESVEVFRKHPFLALFFSLFSSMISRPLCLLPPLFSLTIWPFGSPPSRFYLNLFGISDKNCLLLSPPVLSGHNGSTDTRFSRETMRLMSWPDGERYSYPPQSLVVSLLLSLVSPVLFSRTRGVLFHQNSLTHKFPRFSPTNLCSLVTFVVLSFVFAVTDTAFCQVLFSLGLAELRILLAAPADTRPRTPLISLCTVQLRTLCAAHFLATLCFFRISGPGPGELPGFWGSMVFRHGWL